MLDGADQVILARVAILENELALVILRPEEKFRARGQLLQYGRHGNDLIGSVRGVDGIDECDAERDDQNKKKRGWTRQPRSENLLSVAQQPDKMPLHHTDSRHAASTSHRWSTQGISLTGFPLQGARAKRRKLLTGGATAC